MLQYAYQRATSRLVMSPAGANSAGASIKLCRL
jgi:hypothetical protein